MNSVNLIPLHRLESRQRHRRAGRWLVLFSVQVLLLGGATAYLLGASYTDKDALTQEASSLTTGANQDDAKAADLKNQLQAALKELKATQSVGRCPDWSKLLVMLAGSLNKDVVLSRCQLTPVVPETPAESAAIADVAQQALQTPPKPVQSYLLKLSGYGRTQAGVTQYLLELEKSGLFGQVKLIKTTQELFGSDQAIAFQVECSLRPKEGKTP